MREASKQLNDLPNRPKDNAAASMRLSREHWDAPQITLRSSHVPEACAFSELVAQISESQCP